MKNTQQLAEDLVKMTTPVLDCETVETYVDTHEEDFYETESDETNLGQAVWDVYQVTAEAYLPHQLERTMDRVKEELKNYGSRQMDRPEYITDEHLEFLDNLRTGGTVNMLGATMYVENEFRLTRQIAKGIHVYWVQTFGNPNR